MMGWVRSDARVQGQHTRLWARVIVLREGAKKIALVTEDLNGIPGGMVAAAADLDKDIGYSEQNVLDSASHTHAAPSGFYNFTTYDTVFMTVRSPTDFDLAGTPDPQLYTFMVRRLALAIRRADANLGPGSLGWGFTTIDDLTQNRSIEAALADHGIHVGYGQGSAAMDPLGPLDTIDPEVHVLRVDKTIGGRQVPVGMWSTFANHGTVNKFQFTYYNEDHHGAATHQVEAAIRLVGRVPRGQDVVDAYGNTDEGDVSSGLVRSGPAAAEWVGQVEAAAFLRAWRQAGTAMDSHPVLDWRWSRMCFCGQATPDGPVDTQPRFGLSEFTGSEEGRGPLFDLTRVTFEGDHLPVGIGPQGDKIVAPLSLDVPKAVPLMAVRIADRAIVSVPGEMTNEMGRRVRAQVLAAAAGTGISRAVIAGLANEYADYFTTPEEYDAQAYEGGATIYGRASSDAIEQADVELVRDLVAGRPAPAAYPYDPRNGLAADAPPFPAGATSATAVAEPGPSAQRLEHPSFSWQGGPRGFDRPLDRAFVLVQRRVRGRWRTADSDLGLDVLWSVDSGGVYRAEWEPPWDQPLGTYRFRVQANGYTLLSSRFRLLATQALSARRVAADPGKVAVVLDYPPAQAHEAVGEPAPDATADLTARPASVTAGRVRFLVDGRAVTAKGGPDGRFQVAARPGASVEVVPGAGRDAFGNGNGNDLTLTA
jgi:neutral ceramidase